MPIQMVEFESAQGTLRGALHALKGAAPGPAVLCCHGFTGHRNESHGLLVKASRAFEARGIASLRFDFYGSGESDGAFERVTLPGELSDAQYAFEFLANRSEVDPYRIGVLGVSMGAAIAAALAGCTPSVRAVALWAGVARVRHLFEKSMTPELWARLESEGTLDFRANLLGKALFDSLDEIDPIAGVRESSAPCLIVHGEDDQTVSPQDADTYEAAAAREGRRVDKIIVSGADHTFATHQHETDVIERTADWLAEALG